MSGWFIVHDEGSRRPRLDRMGAVVGTRFGRCPGRAIRMFLGALGVWSACWIGGLVARGGATVRGAEGELRQYQDAQPHMGSKVLITLYASDEQVASRAFRAVSERIERLNAIMSDYDSTSELSRLSLASPTTAPVQVSDDLWRVLEKSQEVSRASEGAFDVTVGPLTKLWRRARRQKQLPPAGQLREALEAVDYRQVVLDPRSRSVELKRPGMRLDLGGIAAGYAADEALGECRNLGISRALVNFSGDLAIGDPPPDADGWKIGIAPLVENGQPSRFLHLANCAVSTSGDAFQFVVIGDQRYSHIVDPRTGLGLTQRSSVTVIADDCITADALATAISVLGPERGLRLADQLPNVAALAVVAEQGEAVARESREFAARSQSPAQADHGRNAAGMEAAVGSTAVLRLVSGERLRASFHSIADERRLLFQTEAGTRTIDMADVVGWGAWSDRAAKSRVMLADGSLLTADVTEIIGGKLVVAGLTIGEQAIPMSNVRGVVLREAVDGLQRDLLWDRIATDRRDQDQLLLENGDLVRGVLTQAPPGEDPTSRRNRLWLRMADRTEPLGIMMDEIRAVLGNSLLVRRRAKSDGGRLGNDPSPQWHLAFRDGTRLLVSMKLVGASVALRGSGGLEIELPLDEFRDELTGVEPARPAVTFLSDEKPLGYKQISFLEREWDYRVDRNVLGGWLRASGAIHVRGIGMHSSSRLAYELGGRFRRFEAELALDEHVGTRGSVIYRVFLANESGEWRAAYESPILRGGDEPLPISIDVQGAARLALLVDFADRGDELDRANWLAARLVP